MRVEASTDVENIAEQRALERAGFTYEGTLRLAQGRVDGLHDLQVWSHVRPPAGPESMTVAPPEPRITRHPDAAAFLAATQAFRAQEPVLTNILGSVAAGVVAGRRVRAASLWLTVDRPDIVGVAMRTAPWNLSVSPMDEDAARALGRFVAIEDPELPGITGPRPVVDAVLEGLAPSRTPRTIIIEVARVLADFRPPDPVEGSARRAALADRDLIIDWHREFGEDVGLPLHGVEDSVDCRDR